MRYRPISWILVAAMAVTSYAQVSSPTDTLDSSQKQAVLDRVNRIMSESAFVPGIDFKKWPTFLEGEKDAIEKAGNSRDFVLAINKALSNFGASHIVMNTPQATSNRVLRKGVGMGVQIQLEEEGVRIVNVFPNSAAEEAGLLAGDLILEADGKKVTNPAELQGEEGTKITLLLMRGGQQVSKTITRRAYSNVRPEELKWIDSNTAMLKVWTFDAAYDRKNVESLMLKASKAKGLILDLRGNPGGAVVNMLHLSSFLMPDGKSIGAFLSRRDVTKYVNETGGSPTDWKKIADHSRNVLYVRANKNVPAFTGRIAVLVNGGSGSAAEIVAASLQENLNSPVIGEKSAGAVLASIITTLPHGFSLQYPIMDYVSPKGRRLEGQGVEPLVAAKPVVKFGEKDEAVEKAALLLSRAVKTGS